MCCVVEVDVIWGFVNPHPFDGFSVVTRELRVHGFVQRGQFRTIALDVLVAIPAGISAWDIRVSGDFDE